MTVSSRSRVALVAVAVGVLVSWGSTPGMASGDQQKGGSVRVIVTGLPSSKMLVKPEVTLHAVKGNRTWKIDGRQRVQNLPRGVYAVSATRAVLRGGLFLTPEQPVRWVTVKQRAKTVRIAYEAPAPGTIIHMVRMTGRDMDRACRAQYGSDEAHFDNQDNPFSWWCAGHGSQGINLNRHCQEQMHGLVVGLDGRTVWDWFCAVPSGGP